MNSGRFLPGALAVTFAFGALGTRARAEGWDDLLDRRAIGADAWSTKHPRADGRGVVVAVLDTGVDPTVPGLRTLPSGAGAGPKVIETRDFSGEGEVKLTKVRLSAATAEAGARLEHDGRRVVGLERLADKPRDGVTYWLGFFEESDLRKSAAADIDANGKEDGRFAVVAFVRASDGEPVVVIDGDGDGDLAGESIRRSYADQPETFVLGKKATSAAPTGAPVALTVTLDWEAHRVELHFDDGGHGTHCAGIAAGFGLEGKAGFDGIAPGARVMSLKIGDNRLAGGATRQGSMVAAIRYASEWARTRQIPVVINLSYGIGTEREGRSAIDRALDKELASNRWLLAAVSAGNEGPGISSAGTPAGAEFAVVAGALLPRAVAETLFGGKLTRPMMFAFSSRGGELAKPDVVAPGAAWSSVPVVDGSPVKAGTSMASPEVAGALAALVSAALEARLPWSPGMVKRAVVTAAEPIAGYDRVDQGAGVVRLEAAWEALRKASGADRRIAGWRAETSVATRPGETASVSYWRVGAAFPSRAEPLAFDVRAVFYGDVPEAELKTVVQTFTLESDVGWLAADRSRLVLKGDGAESVRVVMSLDRLREKPGLYSGAIVARANGLVAFELPVVVIVPHRPLSGEASEDGAGGQPTRDFAGKLGPGEVSRIFIEVPPAATAMAATLNVTGGATAAAWLLPFDPDGHAVEPWEYRASGRAHEVASVVLSTGTGGGAQTALVPGVWELDVAASYRNLAVVPWDLTVVFSLLEVPTELSYVVAANGKLDAELALMQRGSDPFRGTIGARVTAFERSEPHEVKGESLTVPVTIGADTKAVDLTLAVDRDTYLRFTDIAVSVLDDGGRAVAQGGFGQRSAKLRLELAPGRYDVKIIGARVEASDDKGWQLTFGERHERRAPVAVDVTPPGKMSRPTLWPNVRTKFTLAGTEALPEVPEGFDHRLQLLLTDDHGAVWYRGELGLVK